MFNKRQIVRLLTQSTAKVMMQEPTLLGVNRIAKDSPLFHQQCNFNRMESFHTSCKFLTANQQPAENRQALGKIEGKLKISFTCKRCNTRNTKTISKLGYERGVIIIRCDGCKNNHLIADNLGWFTDLGAKRNIEHILAAKGESVCKIHDYEDGQLTIIAKEKHQEVIGKKTLKDEGSTIQKQVASETDGQEFKS